MWEHSTSQPDTVAPDSWKLLTSGSLLLGSLFVYSCPVHMTRYVYLFRTAFLLESCVDRMDIQVAWLKLCSCNMTFCIFQWKYTIRQLVVLKYKLLCDTYIFESKRVWKKKKLFIKVILCMYQLQSIAI